MIKTKQLQTAFILLTIIFGIQNIFASNNIDQNSTQKDKIIFQGKDLKVTQKEVNIVQDYFKSKPFKTNESQYRKFTLELKLFSKEAINSKIIEVSESIDSLLTIQSQDQVEKLRKYHGMYLDSILKDLEISDKIIKSYYLAFPEKFLKKQHDLAENNSNLQNHLKKLDDALKKEIRKDLLKLRSDSLRKQTFKDLKNKYSIKKG